MTDTKLKALVSEAIALDQQVCALQDELKLIKAQLVTEAESRIEEAVKTEGGGKTIVLDGMEGSVARVTFPAPSLRGDIGNGGKPFEKIKAAAGEFFGKLFFPEKVYVPAENFREAAWELLGKSAGPRLIELCETDPKPRVSFQTKAAA